MKNQKIKNTTAAGGGNNGSNELDITVGQNIM